MLYLNIILSLTTSLTNSISTSLSCSSEQDFNLIYSNLTDDQKEIQSLKNKIQLLDNKNFTLSEKLRRTEDENKSLKIRYEEIKKQIAPIFDFEYTSPEDQKHDCAGCLESQKNQNQENIDENKIENTIKTIQNLVSSPLHSRSHSSDSHK